MLKGKILPIKGVIKDVLTFVSAIFVEIGEIKEKRLYLHPWLCVSFATLIIYFLLILVILLFDTPHMRKLLVFTSLVFILWARVYQTVLCYYKDLHQVTTQQTNIQDLELAESEPDTKPVCDSYKIETESYKQDNPQNNI